MRACLLGILVCGFLIGCKERGIGESKALAGEAGAGPDRPTLVGFSVKAKSIKIEFPCVKKSDLEVEVVMSQFIPGQPKPDYSASIAFVYKDPAPALGRSVCNFTTKLDYTFDELGIKEGSSVRIENSFRSI